MTPNGTPVLQIRNLHKSFGHVEVLKGVNLDVKRGERLTILGRSGSGKTTLLRCINWLEVPTRGSILIEGSRIGYSEHRGKRHAQSEAQLSAVRRKTAMVFQQFNLFPHRTALENVIEGPIHVLKRPRDEAVALGYELLDRVGLRAHADKYPAMLSGGQQQRVGIARAVAMKPSVILFDEPTSALDPELVGEVLGAIRDLASTGVTMIIVTHEISFARQVSDSVVFMHLGVIAEQGPPEVVLGAPSSELTRDFLRHVDS